MADPIIGLKRSAFESVAKATKHVLRTMEPTPRIKRRVFPQTPGAIIVEFVVDSFDFDANSATCTVEYVTCGGTIPDDAIDYGGVITVYDLMLCVFDEDDPPDGYIGRHGAATLMEPYDTSSSGGCIWMALAWCCPPESS